MTILVIAEHDGSSLRAATLSTIMAAAVIATLCGDEIHVLVSGHNVQDVAAAAADVAGVSMVRLADAPHLVEDMAEQVESAVLQIANEYSHILLPATRKGMRIAERVAAKLNVALIGGIIAVDAPDRFAQSVRAGNALGVVQSCDPIKIITVHASAFEPAATAGGAASVVKIDKGT